MKKLLFSIFLGAATLAASGASFRTTSFINPPYSSLLLSNAVCGWTNFLLTSQMQSMGLYQVGTNSAGQGINSAIATNYANTTWTSLPPIAVYGAMIPGTRVFNTNAAFTQLTNLGYRLYLLTTNDQVNPFKDVPIEGDALKQWPEVGIGAAGPTNTIGTITIHSMTDTLGQTGVAGAGSNIVTCVFGPVFERSTTSDSGVPGDSVNMPTITGQTTENTWSVSYTNLFIGGSTAVGPITMETVYATRVPLAPFAGAHKIRLLKAYSGASTNAVWLTGVTFSQWVP